MSQTPTIGRRLAERLRDYILPVLQAAGRILREAARDKRFLAAVVILAVACAAWPAAVAWMKISLHRDPVHWAAHVTVDDGFRNTSFPKRIYPYERVEEDGLLDFNERGALRKDGRPDGETIHKPYLLETLFAGANLDKSTVATRTSDWYLSRIYEDLRERTRTIVNGKEVPGYSLYSFWRLDITYFTGGLDTVPHIPEICGTAGGLTVLESRPVAVAAPSGVPGAWKGNAEGQLMWRRVLSATQDRRQSMVYYIFSLNGHPENDRKSVRWKLMDPRLNACYFAKIEINPLAPVSDPDQMDLKVREFIQTCLPTILKDLPMPEDVQKLQSGTK